MTYASTVRLKLHSRWARVCLAAICIVPVAIYAYRALASYRAFTAAASTEEADLQSAVRLEPSNSEYHYRLARYQLYARTDPAVALEHYRGATRLNPYVARYWLDMAVAYQIVGDDHNLRSALERATWAEPTNLQVAWEVANFYLVLGDQRKALEQFRLVIDNDSSQTSNALRLCWRATRDAKVILDVAVPDNFPAQMALLALLAEEKQPDAAAMTWSHVLYSGHRLEVQQALPYIDFLIRNHQPEAAVDAWDRMLHQLPSLKPYARSRNAVTNAGFEQPGLGGGLDWRYQSAWGYRLALDNQESHSGQHSLTVTLEGPAVADLGVLQYLPVEPETLYEFSGYVKTEDLVSASGPRFTLTDPDANARLLITEDFLGTSSWHEIKAEFNTGKNSHLLVLRLERTPADKLVRGKIWIDDLSVTQKVMAEDSPR